MLARREYLTTDTINVSIRYKLIAPCGGQTLPLDLRHSQLTPVCGATHISQLIRRLHPSNTKIPRKMPRPKRDIQAVAEETVTPPDALSSCQAIARVKQGAGNNLYQLELPTGKTLLAELPARFRSTIWIKRGSFVCVDTSTLADRDNKLGGEIMNVVRDERMWRKMSYWPAEFAAKKSSYDEGAEDEGPQMPPSDSEEV